MPWLESEDGKIFDLEDVNGVAWVPSEEPGGEPTLEAVIGGQAVYSFDGDEAAALHARVKDFRKPEPILARPAGPRGARSFVVQHDPEAPTIRPREAGNPGG